ncbi:MAG: fused MFS/spermidine synthase [Microbacteriaceae bacterium]|nr:fused MFS/spermidine synthase [Cryobacterium sp.]MBX3103587.1 fused MFS/spermidine synthase [Cryobacterium sp.]MCC6375864.1 fused MFS/spermidine synthase [Microbacteriaceae bacterium]
MQQYPSVVLKLSGHRAVIEPDRWTPGAYTLVVGGTSQSHVNLIDPTELFFEYIQRMSKFIDLVGAHTQKLKVLHLGAGALTIPRYIEATLPGSSQLVVELEPDLYELVKQQLPWPNPEMVSVRFNDARQGVVKLASENARFDLIVVDVFSGSRIPAHVTSREFYESVRAITLPQGVVLVNVADGAPLNFARSQAATLEHVFGNLIAAGEEGVVLGKRYGNIVLAASQTPFDPAWAAHLSAAGPHPSRIVSNSELEFWIGSAEVVTDKSASPSPPPAMTTFRLS